MNKTTQHPRVTKLIQDHQQEQLEKKKGVPDFFFKRGNPHQQTVNSPRGPGL